MTYIQYKEKNFCQIFVAGGGCSVGGSAVKRIGSLKTFRFDREPNSWSYLCLNTYCL